MVQRKLKPIHPGEVLLEEFLKPMGLRPDQAAAGMGIPLRQLEDIVRGRGRITADAALRLGRYFGTSPQFWLGLQMDYDLDIAQDRLGRRVEREVRPYALAVAE